MRTIIDNILFWILILLIIGVAIWKLVGSPTDTITLITVTLFVASSEVLIWKAFFKLDKKVSISFVKSKAETESRFRMMDSKLDVLDGKLNILVNMKGRKH